MCVTLGLPRLDEIHLGVGQEHTRATLGLPVGQAGGRSLTTEAGWEPTAVLPGTPSFKGSFTSVLPGTGWQLPALSSLWPRGCLLAPTGQSSACLYQTVSALCTAAHAGLLTVSGSLELLVEFSMGLCGFFP